ncbi:MAG: metalloregulator ArsR/SmtB family transcription factor [Bacteroidota bacterium]|nr:metalloregulator ArsR/SmtB family transcription factor [Bacteroidota bacterium]
MTYVKSYKFDKELQELALIAKVLSHPARLAILQYLAKSKTCISGDISNEIPLSRTTVSQHLQELKKAGLIQGEIDGVKINYCICNKTLAICKDLFESFFNETINNVNHEC